MTLQNPTADSDAEMTDCAPAFEPEAINEREISTGDKGSSRVSDFIQKIIDHSDFKAPDESAARQLLNLLPFDHLRTKFLDEGDGTVPLKIFYGNVRDTHEEIWITLSPSSKPSVSPNIGCLEGETLSKIALIRADAIRASAFRETKVHGKIHALAKFYFVKLGIKLPYPMPVGSTFVREMFGACKEYEKARIEMPPPKPPSEAIKKPQGAQFVLREKPTETPERSVQGYIEAIESPGTVIGFVRESDRFSTRDAHDDRVGFGVPQFMRRIDVVNGEQRDGTGMNKLPSPFKSNSSEETHQGTPFEEILQLDDDAEELDGKADERERQIVDRIGALAKATGTITEMQKQLQSRKVEAKKIEEEIKALKVDNIEYQRQRGIKRALAEGLREALTGKDREQLGFMRAKRIKRA